LFIYDKIAERKRNILIEVPNFKNFSTMIKKTMPIYLVFPCMGMIDPVGPMVSLASESITVTINSINKLGYEN
jgi:hypothetical protein